MFYLIGLGLNAEGFSYEAYLAVEKSKKIYLENYTVNLPYSIKDLEKNLRKKITLVDREFVEDFKVLEEARKSNIALFVYGSPLIATTHISLIQEAKKRKIKYKIIHSASILDAVAETGLQLYKFGKTASMPAWQPSKCFTPDSFIDVIKENQKINAHTLLLIDIGLRFQDATEQLLKSGKDKIKLDKIIICQALGTKNSKIIYKDIDELKTINNIKEPYCIIIPGKLHFMEKEILEEY